MDTIFRVRKPSIILSIKFMRLFGMSQVVEDLIAPALEAAVFRGLYEHDLVGVTTFLRASTGLRSLSLGGEICLEGVIPLLQGMQHSLVEFGLNVTHCVLPQCTCNQS